jgi:hypothetical protein
MVRTPIVPFRWVDHGRDVRAYLGGDVPLFMASDIYAALEIPLERGDYDQLLGRKSLLFPFPTATVDDIHDIDGAPTAFFTVDQVRELAADQPMYTALDFSDWFDTLLVDNGGEHLDATRYAIADSEPGRIDLQAGRTFSIRRAALMLSRDPALDYGEKSLFAALSEYMHWIHREGGIWVPTEEVLRAGHLVRHPRIVGPRKTLYPQIRVTPSGLKTLHQRFGGVATLSLETPPALTLLELPK